TDRWTARHRLGHRRWRVRAARPADAPRLGTPPARPVPQRRGGVLLQAVGRVGTRHPLDPARRLGRPARQRPPHRRPGPDAGVPLGQEAHRPTPRRPHLGTVPDHLGGDVDMLTLYDEFAGWAGSRVLGAAAHRTSTLEMREWYDTGTGPPATASSERYSVGDQLPADPTRCHRVRAPNAVAALGGVRV